MRYKVQPEDFTVEERLRLPCVPRGGFAVYRVHKRGVTTLSVRTQMARTLGVPESAVIFPALKDKEAVAVQHAAVRTAGSGQSNLSLTVGGPEEIVGGGFMARFLGHSLRSLTPADIVANHFTLVLRDLSAEEMAHIQERLAQVAQFGLPNYFDQQRFGSLAPGEEPIGKRILQRDAEGALRAYLTQRFVGDPAPVRKFKTFAAEHWGDWEKVFEAAPRPSNYRSVLTYLRDHPAGYRKALNLITQRLLSLYLAAYQSLLWNRMAGRYLAACWGATSEVGLPRVEVAGEWLPLYYELPPHLERDVAIPLPDHRAVYEAGQDNILSRIAEQVLAEEGVAQSDLKARVLKKAYLPRGQRALLLFPQDMSVCPPEPDERFPGQSKLSLTFTLPRGSYATLVIKALVV